MESVTIGKATLFLGDNMEGMQGMADKAFDLAIVDPPYGIDFGQAQKGKWVSSRMAKKDWDKEPPPPEYFAELRRVSRNQVIWGGNYFPLPPTRCFAIWNKGAGFKDRSYAECEQAWTSFDANAKIFNRDPLACGDYKGKIHPTQKPVPLYSWLLLNFAKQGQAILDTHLGSGSSVIACLEAGYSVTAYEVDPDYFWPACERIERVMQQLSLFQGYPLEGKHEQVALAL